MVAECHQINGLAQACSYSRGLEINDSLSQIQALLSACPELSGDYNRLLKVLYVFDHAT